MSFISNIQLFPAEWGRFEEKGIRKATQKTKFRVNPKATEIPPPNIYAQPVSAVYGQIDKLFLVYPANADSRYYYHQVLKELITKMEYVDKFLILCHCTCPQKMRIIKGDIKRLKKELDDDRICFVIIELNKKPTVWAQDPFLPIAYAADEDMGNAQTFLVEPNVSKKDEHVANWFIDRVRGREVEDKDCQNEFYQNVVSPLNFEGGNVLVGDEFVLMGVGSSREYTNPDPYLAEKWFGLPALMVGTDCRYKNRKMKDKEWLVNILRGIREYQPFFHIDMFITLAGKTAKGEHIIVVGQPEIGFPLDGFLDDDIKAIKSLIRAVKKSIYKTVEKLKKDNSFSLKIITEGYALPLVYYDQIKSSRIERTWTWASYNNCLVEIFRAPNDKTKTIRRVWLPSYGGKKSNYAQQMKISSGINNKLNILEREYNIKLPRKYGDWSYLKKFDEQNIAFWKSLDSSFEVVQFENDYNPFAFKSGSLNCITNCMSRKYND